MPRRPPRFDPLSPQGVRITIVQRLVKAGSLAAKGGWPRELHILKKLQKEFSAEDFWLELTPAEQLDSLCWFLGEYGRAALKEQYNLHLFGRAQEQISIDSQASAAMIEATDGPGGVTTLPALRKKESPIAWCDSGGEEEETVQQQPDALASDLPAGDSTGQ